MNVKSFLLGAGIVLLAPVHASSLYKLTQGPLIMNQCPVRETGNNLDLAITNTGYFVVSQGKKNSPQYFTRYGRFLFDEDHYIQHDNGEYLLGLANNKSDKLSKIKVPMEPMPAKATTKAQVVVNLPANIEPPTPPIDWNHMASFSIIDDTGNRHYVTLYFAKVSTGHWTVTVNFDGISAIDKGSLTFNNKGRLTSQEGLHHVYWPTESGLRELNINLSDTTQYGDTFSIRELNQNGYMRGKIQGLTTDVNGSMYLRYSNGKTKKIPGRIALAKFSNPVALAHVTDHLFSLTEESGQPWIHWKNSDFSIISGVLEEEYCLPQQ